MPQIKTETDRDGGGWEKEAFVINFKRQAHVHRGSIGTLTLSSVCGLGTPVDMILKLQIYIVLKLIVQFYMVDKVQNFINLLYIIWELQVFMIWEFELEIQSFHFFLTSS